MGPLAIFGALSTGYTVVAVLGESDRRERAVALIGRVRSMKRMLAQAVGRGDFETAASASTRIDALLTELESAV